MLLLRYVIIVWCVYVPIVLCECHAGCLSLSCIHNASRTRVDILLIMPMLASVFSRPLAASHSLSQLLTVSHSLLIAATCRSGFCHEPELRGFHLKLQRASLM